MVSEGAVEESIVTLRAAAGGGAHLAFDMVGNAKDPNSTLAALGSLYCWGRLVLMGSITTLIPINSLMMMFNNLEIIGNFMHAQNAYLPLLALLRSSKSDQTKGVRAARPSTSYGICPQS